MAVAVAIARGEQWERDHNMHELTIESGYSNHYKMDMIMHFNCTSTSMSFRLKSSVINIVGALSLY